MLALRASVHVHAVLPTLLVAALALIHEAAAQPPPTGADTAMQVAIARATLADGKQQMAEMRWREALAKFEVSVRNDPGPEALLDLGVCQQELGATASAWGTYHRAEERARALGDSERAAKALKRAAALEPRLVRVKVVVDASEPELHVYLDAHTELPPSAWGTALPVDPGTRTVEASAPGKQRFYLQIDLTNEGATETVEIPALARIPPPSAPERGEPLPPPKRPDDGLLKLKITGGVLLFVGYSAGVVMLVDEKASPGVREAGAAMGAGSLGLAAIWAGAELSSTYRMTRRQGLGAAMIGTGIVGVYTSLLAMCASAACPTGTNTFALSRTEWIAIAVGGLGISPGLIAGGYFVMGKDPVKSASRRDPPPLTFAPLVGDNRTGVLLHGSF